MGNKLQHTRPDGPSRPIYDALRVAEERFRLIMENVSDFAIFLIDLEGRVVDWNEGTERLLGYRTEETLGRPLSSFFTPEDRAAGVPERVLREAIDAGRADAENWLLRKDGTRFWGGGAVTALRDDDAGIRGFVMILRDLTERKRLEESLLDRARALTETDRLKDSFLALLSHQLRNPLGTILNGVQILRHADTKGPLAEQTLDMLERQVQQVMRILDDLLDLSEVKRGQLLAKKEPVDLIAAVHQAVTACRPLLTSHDQELSLLLPDEGLRVNGDPVRLEQLINNLLVAASRRSGRGGRITLSLEREHLEAVLRVVDGGPAITADLLPHVFDFVIPSRFGEKEGHDGLGIELALVRRLVEMHGGSVSVTSANSAPGAEFAIRLPLVLVGETEGQQLTDNHPAPPGRPLQLLLLEDNREGAKSLSRLLRLWGHEVRVTYDGPAALHAAQDHRPQAALIDIGLPGMDGYEVARKLRDTLARDVLLIAVTGFGQEGDRQRALEAGFDHHLIKPVDAKELRRLLAEAAAKEAAR